MSTNGITVNGAPLNEYLGAEVGREIENVRTSDERLKVRTPLTTKARRNTSGARTKAGRVIWEKGQKATHVIIKGEEYDWVSKSPYTQSGKSILGAVEFSSNTQELKCHECGEWVRIMGDHVRTRHKPVTVREYKIRHGLLVGMGILTKKQRANCGKMGGIERMGNSRKVIDGNAKSMQARRHISGIRAEMGIVMRSETANLMNACMAQREKLLLDLYKQLGHSPSHRELDSFRLADGRNPLERRRLKILFGTPMSVLYKRLGIKRTVYSKKDFRAWGIQGNRRASNQ